MTDAVPLWTFSTYAALPLYPAALRFSTAGVGGDRDAAGDGDDGDGGVAVKVADGGEDCVGALCAAVASAVVAVDHLDLDGVCFQAADPPLLCARVSHGLCPAPRCLNYNKLKIIIL